MKHNVALKKNIKIEVGTFTDLFKNRSVCFYDINGYKSGVRFTTRCLEALESSLNTKFVDRENQKFVVSICIKKDMLYINDCPIIEVNLTGLLEVDFALSKVVGYSIDVEEQHLVLAGRDVQNWSKQVEVVKVLGKDYQKKLNELKEKYSNKLEKNHIFAFRIIEYRGTNKEFYENDNRLANWDSVGYYQDNFDDKVWNELQRYKK